ncbi:MAG: ORF6C domain-containing protein [Thermomicrobiales bacterium]|nr:ORF6C domain-containing protein [Thermomicrobiales bacterium]
MSTEPLNPIEQREVELSAGDRVLAALVEVGDEERVYVPVRPICEALGVNWPSQSRRIRDDDVLGEEAQGVVMMTTPSADGRGGGPQTYLSLPLEFLHGWLFGFQVSRVKKEHREALLRYKRECYRLLYEAFYTRTLAKRVGSVEGRVDTLENRVDSAALVVGALQGDVSQLKRLLTVGETIGPSQQSAIKETVKGIADLLTERGSTTNPYQGVWGELNRRMGVARYRDIPAEKFSEAMTFLDDWHQQLVRERSSGG